MLLSKGVKMQVDIDDLKLGEVEKVVNYSKWKRTTRLADWRILAVLMVLVGILASSFFPFYQRGYTIWYVIIASGRLTWNCIYDFLFLILWIVSLIWIISDRGFRSVKTSGILFMSYPVLGFLIDSIKAMGRNDKFSFKVLWFRAVQDYTNPATGFRMMFLLGLVLLFMGLCFGAQNELKRINVRK